MGRHRCLTLLASSALPKATTLWLLANHIRAVVLVVRLAILALKAGSDLGAHANTITDFAGGDFVTHANCLANDFMSHTDWHRRLSPTAVDRVHVGTADTASIDFDINVPVLKWLCFELR